MNALYTSSFVLASRSGFVKALTKLCKDSPSAADVVVYFTVNVFEERFYVDERL